MLQQIRRKCCICRRFWFILLTKPISWIIIHNCKWGKSTATWKKTTVALVARDIYREIENETRKKCCEYQLIWIIRSHLLSRGGILLAISTQNDVRFKHLLVFFFRWIRAHIVLMYAREAAGICNIVSKLKTSNYWFEKDAWFHIFNFFSFLVFFLLSRYIRFEMLSSPANPVNISFLTIQSTRFRRLSFWLHCGNKRWKSLKLWTMPMRSNRTQRKTHRAAKRRKEPERRSKRASERKRDNKKKKWKTRPNHMPDFVR